MSPDIRKPSTKLLRRSQPEIDLSILEFNAFDVQNTTKIDGHILSYINATGPAEDLCFIPF